MIKVAVLNIFRNKSRAVLSLLGIVIGVAAIITMVSVVDGMVGEVENAFSNMQGVTIFEEGQIGIFSEIDISYGSKLEAIPGVESAVPTIVALANSVDGKSGSLTGVPTRLIGIGLEGQKMKGA
ncbi:ABC transporter permease, partial [Candidatus Micrarchaeota archaeon]|nr:ABC transporter permease [Candidatus Micrarchaeota archaeon]